jgi:hypothetical protein
LAKPAKKKSKKQSLRPPIAPQPEQPVAPGPVPARKKRRTKKRRLVVVKQKPLPPPIEIQQPSQDPFRLAATFQKNGAASDRPSGSSSISEPKPGQPLTQEQEQILDEAFDEIGVAKPAPGQQEPAISGEGAVAAAMLPDITFDPEQVEDVLGEAFHWIAEKFDSAHWELTEKQSRMLGRPTAQLLTTLCSRLPEFLLRWCDATPGLAGMAITGVIVVGPKVAQQVAISRERRKAMKPKAQPQAVPRKAQAGPVGPIIEAQPLDQ